MNKNEPKKVWEALRATHKINANENPLISRRKVLNLCMWNGESVRTYVNQISGLENELAI